MAGFLADKGRKILANGYNVIPIKPGGKFPTIKDFLTVPTTPARIAGWLANGHADAGIGITTGEVSFVDLDTPTEDVARIMQDATLDIGLAPVRIGNYPKRGLMFRAPEPFTKISSKTWLDKEGREYRIEVLGVGQQFVSNHIHPDTHRPYLWEPGDGPEYVKVSELPPITREQAQGLCDRLDALGEARGWTVKKLPDAPRTELSVQRSEIAEEWGLGNDPVGFDEDRIRAHLFAIPNDDRFNARDDWLDIGFAIQHETSKSAFGETVFEAWSKQHRTHEPALFDKAWKSFGTNEHRGNPVTFRYIIKLAKQYGKETFTEKLNNVKDLDGLKAVCADVKLVSLDELDREELAKTVQTRSKTITGNRLSIKIARNMVQNSPVSTSSINGFTLNEDGVALAFTERYSEKLKFCHTTGHWYAWVGSHWRVETTRLAFDWARETCRDLRGSTAEALSKASAAEAVEKFARADRTFAVEASTWDTDPWLLGTPDGTIDLRTGEIREPRQSDFITKITSVAPGIGLGCPVWLKFLEEATAGNAYLIRFLQQWMGYSLTGDTREENLVFVYGKGGNGKGVWQGVFRGIMGGYVKTTPMDTFAATGAGFTKHSTELANLNGARAVMTSETEEGHAWAEARIKALTGGDDISARFLYKDLFEFHPQFKLTIIGNNKPAIRHVDDAMRRRINIVPFDFAPEKPDETLKERLKSEWSEILLWMIQGCLDWQKNGLIRPEIVLTATEEYFSEQDTFQQWIDECCEIGRFETISSVLWESWDLYARSKREPVGNRNKTFPGSMRAKGFIPVKNLGPERAKGYSGLRLKEANYAETDVDGL